MLRDDRESNANAGIGAGYAAFQLSRALAASGLDDNGQTSKRIERWRNVIEHILQGSASYGSRTPFADVPEWVTLEVVTGGFATGQYMAGGALTEYERHLAASIPGIRPGFERLDLNTWHLTEEGIEVLQTKLASGDYRIEVPEEAALLTVAWLLGQQRTENAWDLVEAIAPFFEELRFFRWLLTVRRFQQGKCRFLLSVMSEPCFQTAQHRRVWQRKNMSSRLACRSTMRRCRFSF